MRTTACAVSFVVLLANTAGFADEKKYVSPTFADIVKRVTSRHEGSGGSGAISRVRAKPDSPRPEYELHFAISQPHDGVVDIRLYIPMMVAYNFECYKLKVDDAIRKELANQKRMVAIKNAERKKWVARQKAHIRKVSNGKLRFGMLYREVEKVLGKPNRDSFAHSPTGAFSVIWGNKLYCFEYGLTDIIEIKKSDLIMPRVLRPPGAAP